MKKFKHISQLKAKQRELNKRKVELTELIHNDWENIKSNLIADSISYGKTMLINEISKK